MKLISRNNGKHKLYCRGHEKKESKLIMENMNYIAEDMKRKKVN